MANFREFLEKNKIFNEHPVVVLKQKTDFLGISTFHLIKDFKCAKLSANLVEKGKKGL